MKDHVSGRCFGAAAATGIKPLPAWSNLLFTFFSPHKEWRNNISYPPDRKSVQPSKQQMEQYCGVVGWMFTAITPFPL